MKIPSIALILAAAAAPLMATEPAAPPAKQVKKLRERIAFERRVIKTGREIVSSRRYFQDEHILMKRREIRNLRRTLQDPAFKEGSAKHQALSDQLRKAEEAVTEWKRLQKLFPMPADDKTIEANISRRERELEEMERQLQALYDKYPETKPKPPKPDTSEPHDADPFGLGFDPEHQQD